MEVTGISEVCEGFSDAPAVLMGSPGSRGIMEIDTIAEESAALMGPQKTRADNVLSISLLTVVEDECISSVQGDGWEELEMYVDSGASETVMGPDMVQSVDAVEGKSYRNGRMYECANGIRIPNMGEKRFLGVTQEGLGSIVKGQVCDINKCLLSVSKMVEKGNRVVFDQGGSYIEDRQTKEKMYLEERRGLYVLKLWTKPAGKQDF